MHTKAPANMFLLTTLNPPYFQPRFRAPKLYQLSDYQCPIPTARLVNQQGLTVLDAPPYPGVAPPLAFPACIFAKLCPDFVV